MVSSKREGVKAFKPSVVGVPTVLRFSEYQHDECLFWKGISTLSLAFEVFAD
jgi:hypothetical protein